MSRSGTRRAPVGLSPELVGADSTQEERARWLVTDMVVAARLDLLRINRRFGNGGFPDARKEREGARLFWEMYDFFFEDHLSDAKNPLSFASICEETLLDGNPIRLDAARQALRRDLGVVSVPEVWREPGTTSA